MDYDQPFPWRRLLRAFRIAFDLRKMLLAVVALLILAAGEIIAARLPFAPRSDGAAIPGLVDAQVEGTSPLGRIEALLREASPFWRQSVASPALAFFVPLRSVADPITDLMDGAITLRASAYSLFRLVWALSVWAIFGGALTRLAALHFARNQRTGVRAALRFSLSRFLSFLSAPLLPLSGLLALWLICVLAGLIGRIPHAGPVLLGVLWIVPLALGLLMAIILIGLCAGWPLMYAAISTEGSDAFDGFSRSFSYVFGRPLQYAGLIAVALLFAVVLIPLVALFLSLNAYLAAWSVAAGMGAGNVEQLHQFAPEAIELFPRIAAPGQFDPSAPELGGRIAGFWLQLVVWLKHGFAVSYFWTAATIIYFLLRRADDAVELDDVYVMEESEPDDLLPLVGVAASKQPVVERPHVAIPEEGQDTEAESK